MMQRSPMILLVVLSLLLISCGDDQTEVVAAGSSCGNGVLDTGEACDPGIASGAGSCPTTCDDGDPCTVDTLAGTSTLCSAECVITPIDNCPSTGPATCGNGTLDAGETCDGDCPTMCDDNNACTTDALMGSAAMCDAVCQSTAITTCVNDDGCCAPGCDSDSDNDCSADCGNGVVDPGETCDGDDCPTTCDDMDQCTTDTLTGSAATCNAVCMSSPISACANDDGCCPSSCTSNNDNDCMAMCGNGVVDAGETCDGANCPTVCNDGNACTTDTLTGSAMMCSAACTFDPITMCNNGDGCCPSGCTSATDSDCGGFCGNNVVDAGETCDGNNCPTECNDGIACTTDTLTGSASTCSAACSFQPIAACVNNDGCCPAGCNQGTDNDCSATCGNNIVDPGESCDGSSCPTTCDDMDQCTIDTLTGSASTCSAACSFQPITACVDNDGCCAPGCNSTIDNDCVAGTVPIGGACMSGQDCQDGACIDETITGFIGGYCTTGCMSNNDCPMGSHCSAISAQSGTGICLEDCNTNQDCRANYECFNADENGANECWPVGSGTKQVGDSCATTSECGGGQKGRCLTEAINGLRGGYCTIDDCSATNPCPAGSHCGAINASSGLGFCLRDCTTNADCSNTQGYGCYDADEAGVNECWALANGPGQFGDPCTNYWDCGGGSDGFCLGPQQGFPNGFCGLRCSATLACPSVAYCTTIDPQTGFGGCALTCMSDADCSTGLTCRDELTPTGQGMDGVLECLP